MYLGINALTKGLSELIIALLRVTFTAMVPILVVIFCSGI